MTIACGGLQVKVMGRANVVTPASVKGSLFLGRVAVCTAKVAYSHRPFPWTICWSVCVCPVHCEKNGGLDPDALWYGRLDGSGDEAGSDVWGSVSGKG